MDTHHNRHTYNIDSAIHQSILEQTSLFFLDTFIWRRTNGQGQLMFGSYPYPGNLYSQNTVEFISIYVKAGKPMKRARHIKESSRLTQKEWVDLTRQVWDIPIPDKSSNAYGQHPALMPVEIAIRCIRLYAFVGDVVLDPFCGSGTTCLRQPGWAATASASTYQPSTAGSRAAAWLRCRRRWTTTHDRPDHPGRPHRHAVEHAARFH